MPRNQNATKDSDASPPALIDGVSLRAPESTTSVTLGGVEYPVVDDRVCVPEHGAAVLLAQGFTY